MRWLCKEESLLTHFVCCSVKLLCCAFHRGANVGVVLFVTGVISSLVTFFTLQLLLLILLISIYFSKSCDFAVQTIGLDLPFQVN